MDMLSPAQLRATILSHGWFSLEPFKASIDPPYFMTAFDLPIGKGAFEVFTENGKCSLKVLSGSKKACTQISDNCLSVDVLPESLYLVGGKKWQWLEKNNMGRFLRSPSLFEDCCKVIFSTNTTWQRTEIMVQNIVAKFGRRVGKHIAFPLPEKVLELDEETLRSETGCGFRAKYILNLAGRAIADPNIFLGEGWHSFDRDDFHDCLLSIKGVGPASANYLSLVYWKPKGFNVDAYVQRRCKERWGIEADGIQNFLSKRYALFKQNAPIVFWFDITKHWHSRKDTSNMEW